MPTDFDTSFGSGDLITPSQVEQFAAPVNALETGASYYAADEGASGTTYAVTVVPAPDAYTDGMMIHMEVGTDCTGGATTLNVNGMGAKSIKTHDQDLRAGDMLAGQVAILIYAGTGFQLVTMPVGLDASRIGDGSVSNAEFECLDGVTSNLQAQIDATAHVLNDLSDVNAPSPDDGDVLTWDASAGKWQASAGGGGGLDDSTRRNILLQGAMAARGDGQYARGEKCYLDGFADDSGIGGSSANYVLLTGALAAASVVTSADPAASVGVDNGYTVMDRSWSLTNDATVGALSAYLSLPTNIQLKIIKRESSGVYSVLEDHAFAHPGGGWAYLVLDTPYTVPSSGDYYVGVYIPANAQITSGSYARAYKSGDVGVGSSISGFSEDPNVIYSVRAVYFGGVDMTLDTIPQIPQSSPSAMRVLLEFESSDSITLGTDLTADVSADNGSHWESCSLSLEGTSTRGAATARSIVEPAEVDVSGHTGTSGVLARIQTFDKAVLLTRLAVSWH